MEEVGFAVLMLLVFAWAVVSHLLERVNVPTALVFLVCGYVLANPRWGVLAVDDLLEEREVVVRAGSSRVAGIPGMLGTSLLEDGTIALVMSPTTCVRLALATPQAAERRQEPSVETRRILLADVQDPSRALPLVASIRHCLSLFEPRGHRGFVGVDRGEFGTAVRPARSRLWRGSDPVECR